MHPRQTALRAPLAALILVGACTSVTASDGGSSTGSAFPADASGATGSLAAACPGSVPASGSRCSEPGDLDCEYGTDWNPMCNAVAECWRGGSLDSTWQLQAAATGSNSPCPTPTEPSPPCPVSLPVADSACGPEVMEILCPYAPVVCGCIQSGDGPAPDASGNWICSSPGSGCPADRPRIGSACTDTSDNDFCAYAVCGIGGVTSCSGGVWMEGVLTSHCE